MFPDRGIQNALLLPFLALVLFLTLSIPGNLLAKSSEARSEFPPESLEVYRYRMKGRVRLLFFWVGKDDVGGGRISLNQTGELDGHPWSEEVEVLFGSNPERVPGGINRWGYGRERSHWGSGETRRLDQLKETVFEGFMRQSKEQSLSEVQRKNESERTEGTYWYDGIQSTVLADRALSEIRSFPATEDFDYRNAKPVFCGYAERLKAGPPDRVKRLEGDQRGKSPPLGFLTSVRSGIRAAMAALGGSGETRWQRLSLDYFYNGHPYQLTLAKLKLLDRLEVPLENGEQRIFHKVAKADFEVVKGGASGTHDFTLWFPVEGPYRGIPVRIVDKPRWWLQIELNVVPTSPGEVEAIKRDLRRVSECP